MTISSEKIFEFSEVLTAQEMGKSGKEMWQLQLLFLFYLLHFI